MSIVAKVRRILIVVGTRPEVIKMAPVYLELKKHAEFEVLLCVTGQHSDLLTIALNDFNLSPDYRLELMQHGQGLGSLTSRALTGLEKIIGEAKPDAILVHGDTTTTFAAALAAFYGHVPIGHVEAGLRTRDIYSPFPEEFNRQAVSRIATWNFAPTEFARQNLVREGVRSDSILVTGNTVVDSLRFIMEKGLQEPKHMSLVAIEQQSKIRITKSYVLLTLHRRENIIDGIDGILQGIRSLAQSNPGLDFVFPVHPNRDLRRKVSLALGHEFNIALIEPTGYLEFVSLLAGCLFVISDSGGIQEEAVTLGKKVILTRNTTERPEGLGDEDIQMSGTSASRVYEMGQELLQTSPRGPRLGPLKLTFGDGAGAERIASILLGFARDENLFREWG